MEKYDIASKSMVSSFVPQIIESTIKASGPASSRDFLIHSLVNIRNIPDPNNYEVSEALNGINICFDYLRKSRAARVHSKGKYIGVWYMKW